MRNRCVEPFFCTFGRKHAQFAHILPFLGVCGLFSILSSLCSPSKPKANTCQIAVFKLRENTAKIKGARENTALKWWKYVYKNLKSTVRIKHLQPSERGNTVKQQSILSGKRCFALVLFSFCFKTFYFKSNQVVFKW